MKPEDFVKSLEDCLGPRLKSVLLYGSATSGDFVPGISGMDLLVVIEPLGHEELEAIAAPTMAWTQYGNPTPELFTPEELVRSADVFAIEFSDLKQSRRVLFGDDPFAAIQVDTSHYRMQLERELKIKLLLLRRKFLAVANNWEQLDSLMLSSVSTFLVLLRAALRLYNDPVPADKDSVPADKLEALEQLSQRIGIDLSAIRRVAEARASDEPVESQQVQSEFHEYLTALNQVVVAIDRHLHPSS